jgi:hypothetical protein
MTREQIVHDLAMACLVAESEVTLENVVERYVNNRNPIGQTINTEFRGEIPQ